MNFNLVFAGSEKIFEIRRDLFLFVKYALEKCGHEVTISHSTMYKECINIIICAHLLNAADVKAIISRNARYAVLNTEIISNDLINFDPVKTDLTGTFLPLMKNAMFTWDIILENMPEHNRYETNAHFLRFGYVEELDELKNGRSKNVDCYFFGTHSQRRIDLLKNIKSAGISVSTDSSCPYFLRNDRIERSRVQLGIRQDDVFTHANALRIAYLANNGCAILSEREIDPAGYLNFTQIAKENDFINSLRELVKDNAFVRLQEQTRDKFMKNPMKIYMEQLLDETFGHALAI